jgi:AcrR family transcriptional regulator
MHMRNSERRSNSLEKLLSASLDVLHEVGYAKFRVADVAQRSGMGEGSLFRYFPTKNDLVRASLQRELSQSLHEILAVFSAVEPEHLTRKILMAKLWMVAQPRFHWTYEVYASAAHDVVLREKLLDVVEEHNHNIADFGAKLVTDMGMAPASDVRRAIDLMTWAMQGLVLNDMVRGDSGRSESLIDYLDFLADSVYGAPVAATNSLEYIRTR